MTPDSFLAGQDLLRKLGAPARLLSHVELVLEAADEVLDRLVNLGVSPCGDFVRIGVALHDAGKILHPAELEESGNLHEPGGESLLLRCGVSPKLARVCLSHARWNAMEVTLEELLVALADKLWKGVRVQQLEERVIDAVARELALGHWDIFIHLDTAFEQIAAAGAERLARSMSR